MRIGSVQLRLRTVAALGVLGVGIPTLALASVSRGAAGSLPSLGTAGTTVTNTVGSALGSTGTSAGSVSTKAGTALSATTTTNTATSSADCPTSGLPADKMTVAGAIPAVAGPNADVVVLAACMRTSSPADLLFQLSSECALTTEVATTGNNTSTAEGTIRMWVEIDGQTVGVVPSHQGTSDDGHVTFCDRAQTQTTSGFVADPNATIDEKLVTMDANAFNWVAMNVGNGVHFITVHAELSQGTAGDATAEEHIGKRTLVVQTTETAQNMAG